jgi:hypothetical protein
MALLTGFAEERPSIDADSIQAIADELESIGPFIRQAA